MIEKKCAVCKTRWTGDIATCPMCGPDSGERISSDALFRAKQNDWIEACKEIDQLRSQLTQSQAECAVKDEALKSLEKVYISTGDGEILRDCCQAFRVTMMHGDAVYRVNYTQAHLIDKALFTTPNPLLERMKRLERVVEIAKNIAHAWRSANGKPGLMISDLRQALAEVGDD